MDIIQLIGKKRDGQTHDEAEIRFLIEGVMSGTVADYQTSAWLMAVCLKGLTLEETTFLTQAYVDSGTVLDLSGTDGIVVDKHSTGGVGDKTTLVLVPLLAAAGVKVGKLSGRGLGFTGGTIDKLEAIPGFQTALSTEHFLSQLNTVGAAISSQTKDLAPADGLIYALRDVTATVDSIPLIAASVMSKKIAAGAPVIVLDIKAGPGAFMKTVEEAQALAETCREVGKRLGRKVSTVISAMTQPLGNAVGHRVEVEEALRTLQGKGPSDLVSLCLTLGSVALVSAGLFETREKAADHLSTLLANGQAFQKFQELVTAQGGNIAVFNDTSLYPQPTKIQGVEAPTAGVIHAIDPLSVARAVKTMGGGRQVKTDPLDLSVGVILHKKVGETVQVGDTLAEVQMGAKNTAEALALVQQAFKISMDPLEARLPLVYEIQG